MSIRTDGIWRYFDKLFVERMPQTMKYDEVYLKAYASPSWAPKRGWKNTSVSTTSSGPTRPWAIGPWPRCSMGSREP